MGGLDLPIKALGNTSRVVVDARRIVSETHIRLAHGSRPRLSVFRSQRYVYAQIIDDFHGKTLASASSMNKDKGGANKTAAAEVGALIAEKAQTLKIKKVTFDRNGFIYHGVIKTLADAARSAGLEF